MPAQVRKVRKQTVKITSSYGVELRKQNIPIRQTLDVYRSAVSYLTEIYAQVWEELERIPETKKRFNEAEHLIHTTKKNQARFDFDIRFPKDAFVSKKGSHPACPGKCILLQNPTGACGKRQGR